jgi:hypothetical protein
LEPNEITFDDHLQALGDKRFTAAGNALEAREAALEGLSNSFSRQSDGA